MYKCAENYKDFSILAPRIEGVNYKNEYYVKKNVSPNVHSMNFVTGCALFFNMDALDVIGKFDEKIFLYYEENDLYLRSLILMRLLSLQIDIPKMIKQRLKRF